MFRYLEPEKIFMGNSDGLQNHLYRRHTWKIPEPHMPKYMRHLHTVFAMNLSRLALSRGIDTAQPMSVAPQDYSEHRTPFALHPHNIAFCYLRGKPVNRWLNIVANGVELRRHGSPATSDIGRHIDNITNAERYNCICPLVIGNGVVRNVEKAGHGVKSPNTYSQHQTIF